MNGIADQFLSIDIIHTPINKTDTSTYIYIGEFNEFIHYLLEMKRRLQPLDYGFKYEIGTENIIKCRAHKVATLSSIILTFSLSVI